MKSKRLSTIVALLFFVILAPSNTIQAQKTQEDRIKERILMTIDKMKDEVRIPNLSVAYYKTEQLLAKLFSFANQTKNEVENLQKKRDNVFRTQMNKLIGKIKYNVNEKLKKFSSYMLQVVGWAKDKKLEFSLDNANRQWEIVAKLIENNNKPPLLKIVKNERKLFEKISKSAYEEKNKTAWSLETTNDAYFNQLFKQLKDRFKKIFNAKTIQELYKAQIQLKIDNNANGENEKERVKSVLNRWIIHMVSAQAKKITDEMFSQTADITGKMKEIWLKALWNKAEITRKAEKKINLLAKKFKEKNKKELTDNINENKAKKTLTNGIRSFLNDSSDNLKDSLHRPHLNREKKLPEKTSSK